MVHDDIRRGAKAFTEAPSQSSSGGLALLEDEIAGLREENARLQRRLAEAEMSEKLKRSADRILAIPAPNQP
jgi:hypothetical protein